MGIIGSIRKHSWLAVLLVGIAIVAFIIGDLSKNNKQKAFAKLDGEEITYEYFNARLNQSEKNSQGRNTNTYAFKEAVWQDIVTDRLLGKELVALGITVSDSEMTDMYVGRFIHRELLNQFRDAQTGAYNVEQVRNIALQIDNLPDTMEAKIQWIEYQERLRDDRRKEKYYVMLTGGMYMPNAIAQKIAEISAKTSDVRVAALPYSQITDVTLTDADYQQYFDAHRKELNKDFFGVDQKIEVRELVYAVFTATPSEEDMANINKEVGEWWNEMQTLQGTEFSDFVNMHGYYDTMFYSSDVFAAPLDTIIKGSAAGKLIDPQVVNRISAQEVYNPLNRLYVMGKVLKTEMRPDSLRFSTIFIPNENYKVQDNAGNAQSLVTRSVEETKHLRDSAMAAIAAGMPFEEAFTAFSHNADKDTSRGDSHWMLDGTILFNEEVVHHNIGDVFNYDLPNDRGHIIVKVTNKTAPKMKYRVALVTKDIVPSSETERAIREKANQFASRYTTCRAMMEGAQSENIQLHNMLVISMTDSLDGLTGTRDAIRWAFDEKTGIDAVSGQLYASDYNYAVVALRDVYNPGKLTLEQVRHLNPQFESLVRNEVIGKQLMEKAQQAMNKSKDIEGIATALNIATVDTVLGANFMMPSLGRYGMEPRVMATIAAKNTTGLVGPIQGASGVYIINIDSNAKGELMDPSTIRQQYETTGQRSISFLMSVLLNRVKLVDNRLLYM